MKNVFIREKLIFFLLSKFFRKNLKVYNLCKRYIDIYNGENQSDMRLNGEFRFIRNNLGSCSVAFDIGANVGNWTKCALKINKNLKIHCFEPSKYTFKKLIENNFPPQVVCNNFGLSSQKNEQILYAFKNWSGGNSLYKRQGLENSLNQELEEYVKLNTLEDYCQENDIKNIDFLKIDTEGHDLEIIKGGKNLFKNGQVTIIQFEYGGCNIDARVFLKDFFAFFSDMKYSFYKIYPDCIKKVNRYDQRLENFQYQNWLIIKNNYDFLP